MGILKRRVLIPGLLTFALALSLISGCGQSPEPDAYKQGGLALGDKAYNFSLMDNTGQLMKLSDVQEGWYLVLILYRGHWCSACLNQLLDLKNDFPKFTQLHASMAAASTDPVEDSADFMKEWRFPFPLLSDTKLQVIDAYGARHPRGHEEKDIAHPSVIIIDPQKIVRYKYVGKVATDRPSNDEILFALQQIEQQAAKH